MEIQFSALRQFIARSYFVCLLTHFHRRRLARLFLIACLAVLAPCVTAAATLTAPNGVPTRFESNSLTGLTVTSEMVYWHMGCGDDFYPSRSYLQRRVANGVGEAETRYSPRTCDLGAVASANVAVDASHVYWIEPDGRIMRQQANGASLTPVQFGETQRSSAGGYPPCCLIAVDNTYVYWSEGRSLYRKAKSGGVRSLVFTETAGEIRDLRVGEGGALYYLAGGVLRTLRPSGAGYSTSTVENGVAAYALDATRIYYGNASTSEFYIINSLRISDLGDFRNHYVSDRVGHPRLTNIVVDTTNLYWHDKRGAVAAGPIWRKPLNSSLPAVQLTAYLSNVNQLQLAGNRLFWTDFSTGIWMLETNADAVAPPAGDLEITEVHITQGIQSDDNRVPLLAGKPTIVRVFVRGALNNTVSSNVVARMQVQGDPTRYEIGPLTIPASGSNRYMLNDSFTFRLSNAATSPGSRTLSVTVSPFSGLAESNTTNNTVSRLLTFGPYVDQTWYGASYGNTNTTCAGAYARDGYIPPFNRFEPHRLYTENLLPVSTLNFIPLPGNPQRLFDNSGSCTAYETAQAYFVRFMADLFPSGGRKLYFLTPESTGYYGLCCTNDAGNRVGRGQDYTPDPGPTMAHEIGHGYGGRHTFEDANFPRPNESMGPYLGFRHFSNEPIPRPQILRGETNATTFLGDIMSYIHPEWVSPYTYCLLANTMSAGAIRCPAGLDGIPSASTSLADATISTAADSQSYLHVSGYLDSADQMVLLPFEQIEVSGNPIVPMGSTYILSLETLKGEVLPNGNFSFDIAPLVVDGLDNTQPQTQRTFGFYIPWNPSTEVIRISTKTKLLAERAVSPNAPQFISLDFPTSGPVNGVKTVNWSANDKDGDPLTYSVWYSANNGQHWLPVDVAQAKETTQVDFNNLPGSQQALLRVLASDGVRTSAQVSAAFVVPSHPPIVSAKASLDDAGYLAIAAGTAYDAEDGAINEPTAYVWTSNWQGEVGRGPWLSVVALAPGMHTLILAVSDRDGNVNTTTLNVRAPNRTDASAIVLDPASANVLTMTGVPTVTAMFPVGAVNEQVRVAASYVLSPTIDLPGSVASVVAVDAYTMDSNPVKQFVKPFILLTSYEEILLNGASETQLGLFVENEQSGFWEQIESTVDMEKNRVTAQLDHPARFALVVIPVDIANLTKSLYLPMIAK